jgi:hypothetical protein
MYLVHVRLRGALGRALPEQTGSWVRAAAGLDDGVEHVSVHRNARPDPVLGVYVIADFLEAAERVAAAVCARALRLRPELRAWAVLEGRVPLLLPYGVTEARGAAQPAYGAAQPAYGAAERQGVQS